MSETKIVEITIEDLEEIVGGLNALQFTAAAKPGVFSPSLVARDPDTCPNQPGTPVSTCMCPGSISIGAELAQQEILF